MPDTLRKYLSMPLLTKELAEQAGRRRTYIIRFLYAAILFGVGLFIIYGRGAQGGVANIGQGRAMFDQVFGLQLIAILLVLPATCAGAFAGEKERESLSLLLLTTIPAPLIVLQKLLSRVIPMLAFVILSFPLMATAYSFGGVRSDQLLGALLFLLFLTLLVGSVAIMASTYCRTTLEAYLLTYLVMLASTPFILASLPQSGFLTRGSLAGSHVSIVATIVQAGILILPLSIFAGLLATLFLYRRAFVPPKNILLTIFRKLDHIFFEMNHVTGGVILVQDAAPYPTDDPISWRETSKRSLGTFRYLFRLLVIMEVPILFISQTVRYDSTRLRTAMTVLLYLVWIAAIVLTAVHSASVVSAERSRQTLDVLLVCPISGRDLISQKLSGVNRLFWMLMVPFASIFLYQQWFYGFRWDLRYLILHFGAVFAILKLVKWMGMAIGLQSRNQMRATITLLSILACMVASGPMFDYVLDLVGYPAVILNRNDSGELVSETPPPLRILSRVTPANWLVFLEQVYPAPGGQDSRWERFWGLAGVLSLYGLAAWGMRAWILASADPFLGRVHPGPPIPPRIEDAPQTATA